MSVDSSNTSAVLLGSTIVFNCTSFSSPVPHKYRFFRNQVFLGSNVSGVYHLQMRESGVYSCMPVNSAGVGESANVNLTVVGKFPKFLHHMYICNIPFTASLQSTIMSYFKGAVSRFYHGFETGSKTRLDLT